MGGCSFLAGVEGVVGPPPRSGCGGPGGLVGDAGVGEDHGSALVPAGGLLGGSGVAHAAEVVTGLARGEVVLRDLEEAAQCLLVGGVHGEVGLAVAVGVGVVAGVVRFGVACLSQLGVQVLAGQYLHGPLLWWVMWMPVRSQARARASSLHSEISPRRIASPNVTIPAEEKGAGEPSKTSPSVVRGTPIASKTSYICSSLIASYSRVLPVTSFPILTNSAVVIASGPLTLMTSWWRNRLARTCAATSAQSRRLISAMRPSPELFASVPWAMESK